MTEVKTVALIDLKSTERDLRIAVKNFTGFEGTIEETILSLNNLPAVIDKESRDENFKAVSAANKLVKEYESLRKSATSPLDTLKKEVMNHQRMTVNPLESVIATVKSRIMQYDQEEERKRQEELARIEAERKAREEAERRERERIEGLKSRLSYVQSNLSIKISQSISFESLDRIITEVNAIDPNTFEEFKEDAEILIADLTGSISQRQSYIREQNEIRKAQEEAAKANAEEARKLAEMRKQQVEEQERQRQEQERLRREAEALERQKKEQEAERIRLEEETRRREEEEAMRKEFETKKAKGLSSGIDEIEITDLMKVPTHLYDVKVNKRKVIAYLKTHDEVPGLKVSFKDKLILNAK